MVLLGVMLGAFGCYFFFQRDIDRIDGRLDGIQQQITAPASAPEVKLPDGKPGKGRKGH